MFNVHAVIVKCARQVRPPRRQSACLAPWQSTRALTLSGGVIQCAKITPLQYRRPRGARWLLKRFLVSWEA
jgi:hypothetical protein